MNGVGGGTGEVTVTVNGGARALPAGSDLHALVSQLGLAERKGVAIAIDGRVVPRKTWPGRTLVAGEKVLVIQATQGG